MTSILAPSNCTDMRETFMSHLVGQESSSTYGIETIWPLRLQVSVYLDGQEAPENEDEYISETNAEDEDEDTELGSEFNRL